MIPRAGETVSGRVGFNAALGDAVTPDETFEEALRVSERTLADRGFASNFCAAWLAFWHWALAEYGTLLEEAHRLTYPDVKPKPAAKIIASCMRSTMALLSAAVRADKY